MTANIKTIGNDTGLDRILNRDFVFEGRSGYVEVGEDKICLPIYYKNYAERFRKFDVRDDDVFICAHPKTGTTWLQEMVWLIVNDLDYEGAQAEILERFPQLELGALFDMGAFDLLATIEQRESPRCIKTHLHWSLLPEQIQSGTKLPKIITTFRNPQDTCVSLYHHSRLIEGYKGTFEDFCELFLAGRVPFGPFWKQVLSYWQQRNRPNILFVKYEEMKENLPDVIKKVAHFLGKNFNEVQVKKLAKHLSFESMKGNPNVNHRDILRVLKDSEATTAGESFMRSGKVGTYKYIMSSELIERFEEWTEENLAGMELSIN